MKAAPGPKRKEACALDLGTILQETTDKGFRLVFTDGSSEKLHDIDPRIIFSVRL